MAKLPQHAASTSTGPQPVTKKDFAALATFLAGKDGAQRMFKKDLNGEAVRTAGELYENREYVVAYETFKPAYDKVVGDMQRVLRATSNSQPTSSLKNCESPWRSPKKMFSICGRTPNR